MSTFSGSDRGSGPTIFDIFNRPLADFVNGRHAESFRIDVKLSGGSYILKADLPGAKKGDIKLGYADGVLTISAEHHRDEGDDGQGYIVREREGGVYERSVSFPDVDPEKISASFTDGTLTVVLERAEEPAGREIRID
ncbi:MAG: Hsp20 family protein [Succinivibrio sp.]|jgi:HSP20 family protein|nr:Hsp20 family protein [Succinivibrio sp.]